MLRMSHRDSNKITKAGHLKTWSVHVCTLQFWTREKSAFKFSSVTGLYLQIWFCKWSVPFQFEFVNGLCLSNLAVSLVSTFKFGSVSGLCVSDCSVWGDCTFQIGLGEWSVFFRFEFVSRLYPFKFRVVSGLYLSNLRTKIADSDQYRRWSMFVCLVVVLES